jgi:mercuric ion transport protein
MIVARALDKTSSLGTLVAAMSCAGCFPALGSLGAALGLGVLGQYEGFLFRKLLPALAVLALLVNACTTLKGSSLECCLGKDERDW